MKIKSRNLLTVILAMLCAVAVAIGVSFALPKNNTKTAYAATELYDASAGKYNSVALDALAKAAKYSDINDMLDALDTGAKLNASNFGSYQVTFGGKNWWPVYASGNSLTLWLASSLGDYSYSDGTWNSNASTGIKAKIYTYSWIRAAINAGNTSLGYYYGKWNNSDNVCTPTQYQNNVKSPAAPMAPTSFTAMADFVSGKYSSVVLPGAEGDKVWLPSTGEAASGGTWKCSSTQWAATAGREMWTRTPSSSSTAACSSTVYTLSSSGGFGGDGAFVNYSRPIFPAINIDLTTARRASAPTDVSVTYNGSVRDIDDSEIKDEDKAWYDSTLMTLTYPTASTDDMKIAGTYTVKAELKTTAIAKNYIFTGDADPTKGAGDESDTLRYFDFTINKKELTLPTLSGTHSYNGSAQDFSFLNYDKKELEVTAVEVKPKSGSTITLTAKSTSTRTDGSTYPVSWADSNGDYPVTLDDSASIVKLSATDAGDYKVTIGLLDTDNYKWASGVATDKKVAFTLDRAAVTVTFGSPVSTGGFSWKVGDFDATNTGELSVQSIGGVVSGEDVKVDLYWYSNTDKTPMAMYTTGVPDSTKYDVTNFDSYGADTYYLCATLANDASGADVNRNYKIATKDTNVTPNKDEVAVQRLVISPGVASVDNVKWQYITAAMADPADYVYDTANSCSNISYDKVSGSAVVYTMSITGIPTTWKVTYGQIYMKSDAGTYTAKVTIDIPADEQANTKFPDPSATGSTYVYAGQGNYTYKTDSRCEITFDWTIEKKEIDLSSVAFEYTTDGGINWAAYNSSNPPEGDGATTYFEIRVPLTSLTNLGVTGAPTVSNYGNQYGPGDVTFDLDFTFDSNHKAKSGQNEHQMSYSMKTTGKKLAVKWNRVQLKDGAGNVVKDTHGMPYFVYELDTSSLPADALQYIKYEYYEDYSGVMGSQIMGGTDIEKHKNIGYIIDPTGMDANSQNPKTVYVKAILDGVPMMGPANDVPQYVFDTTTNPVEKRITIGDNRKAVDVTAGTLTSMTYGSTVNIADAYEVAINTPHVILQPNQYTVELYLGATLVNADATAQDFSTLNAGRYTLKFTLDSSLDAQYALTNDSLDFEIKPVEITVPTVKADVKFTFNGLDQQLESQLEGWNSTYMEWDISSIHEAYHADTYTAIIKIKDEYAGNYVFVLPASGAATTKHPVKVTVDGAVVPTLSGDKTTATLPWTIEKYVYDTTNKNAWNFAKDGATLSFNGVPATIKALTMGDNPRLVFGTAYFDLDGNPLTGELTIKGGDKYKVAAYLDPNCADAKDIEFKGANYDPMLQMTTSPQAAYTVPKSGASAFLGTVKEALTKVYAGLPLWAWLLIALALLILLIIIIVVACKRRKTKEEKEEIKARKEEEKRLKEEERQRREEEREAERQRREEERRLQQEKLEAERELAKAKQEAELEKIRAQAGMAGMATVAVAQPPVQEQVPVQQVPVQQVQTVDNELLKEMREQMAELRADNKMTQAQLQALQNSHNQPQQPAIMAMPQPVYQQPAMMPMPQPQYYQQPMMPQMPMQMPMPNYGGGNDNSALARMEAQLNAMQAEQRARYDAEQRIEIAAMRAEQHVDRDSRHSVDLAAMREHINGYSGSRVPDYSQPAPQAQPQQLAYNNPQPQPNSLDTLGALVAATLKNMVNGAPAPQPVPQPQPAELPQKAEQSAPVTAKYPSDAVITTTTTVDTTKNKPLRREEDTNFDIDGFYDPLD